MIIQVVILLIIIIIWLQYPQTIKGNIETENETHLYKKIFNIVKIPIVIICFISIIYNFLNINPKQNSIRDLNVYMSIPKF